MVTKVFLFVASLLLLLLIPSLAAGAVWYVDGSVTESGNGQSWPTAFKAIQEGIDASSHGDTVIVAEGVHDENIQFYGKSIVLRSTDPDDAVVREDTIIDGGKRESVVRFQGNVPQSRVPKILRRCCTCSAWFQAKGAWKRQKGGRP
jgi:hypothetical protein